MCVLNENEKEKNILDCMYNLTKGYRADMIYKLIYDH